MLPNPQLLSSVTTWLESESSIKAAVLFGSSAREMNESAQLDQSSDIDLHVVTTDAQSLLDVEWERVLPNEKFYLQAVRSATGGVRKITVLFASGQVDLVLIPATQLKIARMAMRIGLHRRPGKLQTALNEIHASIRMGYKFIKGEAGWGNFYSRVMAEMTGVRLTNSDAASLAAAFLCEILWVLQKLERGELCAAQHSLHRSLAETNYRLIRELRLRRGQPLPSFGLARHFETLLTPEELGWVQINARLDHEELYRSTWRSLGTFKVLMASLDTGWLIPDPIGSMLSHRFPQGTDSEITEK